jgi:hypothetical protein
MTTAQKFALVFVGAYFLFVFCFASRFDLNRPLPASLRWIPLFSIIGAMILVALLSRNHSRGVPIEKRDVDVSKHASWPIRGMLLLYGITISATMVAVLIGAVSLRIAVPGLVVNLALITLLSWIDRSKTTRIR